MQDFTKLIAWQKAHALALRVVESLPPSTGRRVPGLRAQAIRSALGIGQNIAEGCGKRSGLEPARYADIAGGSLMELRCQLIQARDTKVLSEKRHAEFEDEIEELRKILVSLALSVRERHRLGE